MRNPTTRDREIRAEQTKAETAAWSLLRNRRLGLKFHRQYPGDKYVVDFFCFEQLLAIELDGGVHSQPSQIMKDAAKDVYLRGIGIVVLRLANGLVLKDPGRFIQQILEAGRS